MRTTAWWKMPVSRGQEIAIGANISTPHNSILPAVTKASLIYVARVGNGFVPAQRTIVRARCRSVSDSLLAYRVGAQIRDA